MIYNEQIADLKNKIENLKLENERIKTRYGEHLDKLNNDNVILKNKIKIQAKAYTELLIYLQDPEEYKKNCEEN